MKCIALVIGIDHYRDTTNYPDQEGKAGYEQGRADSTIMGLLVFDR